MKLHLGKTSIIATLALLAATHDLPAQAQSAGPVFVSFSVPATVAAGTPARMEVVVDPVMDGPVTGHLRAWVEVSGPSGQRVTQYLYVQAGMPRFVGNLQVSSAFEPGTWRIETLSIDSFVASGRKTTVIKRGDTVPGGTFQPTFTVTNTGAGDKTGAPAQAIMLSPAPTVASGARLTIQVRLQEPPGGVRQAMVQLTTVAQPRQVFLKHQPTSGLWQGAFHVPLVAMGTPEPVTIDHVEVVTAGGVVTRTTCGSLPAAMATCSVNAVYAQPWPELQVPYTLPPDLYHAGGVDFRAWHTLDKVYVEGLFDRLAQDPNGVREILYGQLPSLGPAIDATVKEAYVDKQTNLRIATPMTTGKYLTLGGAARGRWLVMGELDRRELGYAMPLLRDAFDLHWKFEDPLRQPPAPYPVLEQAGGMMTQRTIEIVRDSQIPAPVWALPHGEDFFNLTGLTKGPISWIHPSSAGPLAADTSSAKVVLFMPSRLPSAWVDSHTVVHEYGHTFHMVFVNQPRSLVIPGMPRMAGPLWTEYLGFRGNFAFYNFFDIFYQGRPHENFAEDFANTFDQSDFPPRPEPEFRFAMLREDPVAEQKFKDFVAARVKSGPLPNLTIDWEADRILATLPGPYTLKGKWRPDGTISVNLASMETVWMNNTRTGLFKTFKPAADGTWSVTLPDGISPLQTVQVWGENLDRSITQSMQVVLFRYPLLMDAVPVQTTANTVKLSGRTVVGWTVSVQGQPVTVDGTGHFEMMQPLVAGLNQLRVTARPPIGNATPAAVVVEVVRGTAAEAAAITNRAVITGALPLLDATKLPFIVWEAWREPNQLGIKGITMAGATVVFGTQTVTAGADGTFEVRHQLRDNFGQLLPDVYGTKVITAQLGARSARLEILIESSDTPDAGVAMPDAGVATLDANVAMPDAGVAMLDAPLADRPLPPLPPDAPSATDAQPATDRPIASLPADAAAPADASVVADAGATARDSATTTSSDSSGCSCSVGARTLGAGPSLLALLALATTALSRARRRRR